MFNTNVNFMRMAKMAFDDVNYTKNGEWDNENGIL